MPVELEDYIKEKAALVEEALRGYLDFAAGAPERLAAAMRYACLNGGKRIRPVLMLSVMEILNGYVSQILPAACALELVHSYSLAHDDLPCMDDADLRRGRPACHKQFDEAAALLAGDTLQAYAYEVLIRGCDKAGVEPRRILKLSKELSRASGIYGMAGGQMTDLSGAALALPDLQKMHERKTGALLKYAVLAPLYVAETAKPQRQALNQYAEAVGLAFQIKDDILDVEGTAESLGKTPGKDLDQQKNTYVTLLGLDKARELLRQEMSKAYEAAEFFGARNRLLDIARYLLERKN
ncbi:MAG: polyprenyl synthetase family protein [Candidatus Margulisbacteria bacterium]|nr:polyprenyl synthetase family protein [Candidatus Margulisiibacteriota bacterium]